MSLAKQYDPQSVEPKIQAFWQQISVYEYDKSSSKPVFSIDTPPATVSGKLHLGHVYSYSHTDFIARYKRMTGYNVFYPMGFDDNGLPTERLLEKSYGVSAKKLGRQAFIEKCLEISKEFEADYEHLWRRLALSNDWRFKYRTIDHHSQKIAQLSFLDLYRKDLVERRFAPAIWCPECKTALAQAELIDIDRDSEFATIAFSTTSHMGNISIASTRPELLPACVAIFVNPEDQRFKQFVGHSAKVPIFGQDVPILEDRDVDPEKGTGAVMCCTFGDQLDVIWWQRYKLPLIEAINQDGKMTDISGQFVGLDPHQARDSIKAILINQGLLSAHTQTKQSFRAHERCDTPVEYIITNQWFVKLIEHQQKLLQLGNKINWHPEHMQNRYLSWVSNLSWDWCISRQRVFGVPFPVWYCTKCGQISLANEDQLPVDPFEEYPDISCPLCGNDTYEPETDVMDTWATSSMSPQIASQWQSDMDLYSNIFPMSLRPQAHEIIRTWAFYTIVKSDYHFSCLPWNDVLISGWGIAGEGMGKISKSRGGGPLPPLEMISRYSTDAVRYWAASTGPGKDAIISEEKIQLGRKLTTKLWNVARFSEQFIQEISIIEENTKVDLSPADRWILSRIQIIIVKATDAFNNYEYAAAKSEIETFFWQDFTDNYIEMAKQRLYLGEGREHVSAQFTLYYLLNTLIKLFAPFLPYVTEEIYQELFTHRENILSIHASSWPKLIRGFIDDEADQFGEMLVEVAVAVRRYKSEHSHGLGFPIKRLLLVTQNDHLNRFLLSASADLSSITRAENIECSKQPDENLVTLSDHQNLLIQIQPN